MKTELTKEELPEARGLAISTFEAAKWLGVVPGTVQNWYNNGALTGYKTRGGHRRIYRDGLIAFAQARSIPLDIPKDLLPYKPPAPVAKEPTPPEPPAQEASKPSIDLAALEVAVKSIGASLELVNEEIEKLKQAR